MIDDNALLAQFVEEFLDRMEGPEERIEEIRMDVMREVNYDVALADLLEMSLGDEFTVPEDILDRAEHVVPIVFDPSRTRCKEALAKHRERARAKA